MPNDLSPVSQSPDSTLASSQAEILDRGFLASKRWTKLIPIAFVTYSLAYLDRSNFSIAVAGGMKSDLQLDAALSALVGASFFLGYFFFQIPGAIYAERKSAVRLVFWSSDPWGALASLQGLLYSATWLIIVRFGVGVVEAAVLPAMVILLANWFTKERGRANTYLILGNPITVMWLSAVSGYLIELTSWRGMFIIEGIPAIAWAFVFRYIMRDKPRDAKWLDAKRGRGRRGRHRGRAGQDQALRRLPAGPDARATSSCCPCSTSCGAWASTASSSGCPPSCPPAPSRHRPHRPDLRHPLRLRRHPDADQLPGLGPGRQPGQLRLAVAGAGRASRSTAPT